MILDVALLRLVGLLTITAIAAVYELHQYYKPKLEERVPEMHDPLEDGMLFD